MDETPSIAIPIDVGQKVRMHFPHSRSWTVVRGWKPPDFILVDIPEENPAIQDESGAHCEIQYLRGGTFHRFETEILGVLYTSTVLQFLMLRYPERITSQNLRSFPRIKTSFQATMLDPNGKSWPGTILDLSLGGCRAKIAEATLTPGDQLELSCVLPDQRAMADVPCVVRRSYGAHVYGLEFDRPTEINKEVLEDFLQIFTKIESIEDRVETKQGMVGDLEQISLPDLLQVLVSSGKPYQVDITQKSERGRVYVKDGRVLYANTIHQMGADAIFELFTWSKGRYRIQKAEWIPEPNVNALLEYLVLEHARRIDQDAMAKYESSLDLEDLERRPEPEKD